LQHNKKNVPEIIVVKKIFLKKRKRRNWKLLHLEKHKIDLDESAEPLVEAAGKKKVGKNAKKMAKLPKYQTDEHK
jgi:hypothetical protein